MDNLTGFLKDYGDALATILAGLIALIVYRFAKVDNKKNAATIIYQEIIGAEARLEQLLLLVNQPVVKHEIDFSNIYILKTNHWNEYQHLFVKNFSQHELTQISNFFDSCQNIDESISDLRLYTRSALEEKTRLCQQALLDIAFKTGTDVEYANEKERVLRKRFEPETDRLVPNKPINDLQTDLTMQDKISTTNIGARLERISQRKWYDFFLIYKM